MKIVLTDTFNNHKISSHRTVGAAVKARRAHSHAVATNNMPDSHVSYRITYADGTPCDGDEIMAAQEKMDCR